MTDKTSSEEARNSKDYKKPLLSFTEVSCILSAIILAWGVSIPFRERNESLVTARSKAKTKQIAESQQETEKKAREAFHAREVQYLQFLEDDLMAEARNHYAVENLQGEQEVAKFKQQRKEAIDQQVQLVIDSVPEGKIEKGTMEWQTIEELKRAADDYR